MLKQTLRGGKIIGTIQNSKLPVELHGLIGTGLAVVYDDPKYPTGKKVPGLALARRNQHFALGAIPSAALLGGTSTFFLPQMLEATRQPNAAHIATYAMPILTAAAIAIEVSESKSKVQDVRKIHELIGQALTTHYTHNPEIRRHIDAGATHFAVDGKGNLHFIVAERKLAGKPFRPVFGRMRGVVKTPLPEGEKIPRRPVEKKPRQPAERFRYEA